MSYSVDIRRNEDGVIHRYENDMEWDAEGSEFMWGEGNFACDCNRALFFARAVGEEDPERSCGNEAFSVRCVAEDGTVLYEDEAWEDDE